MFEKKSANQKPSGQNSSFDKIVIHTMEKDLKNPSGAYPAAANTPEKITLSQTKEASILPVQEKTGSPFLSEGWPNQNNKHEAGKMEEKKTGNITIRNTPKEKTVRKSVFSSIIILIILLLAAGGGYYFWKTQMNQPQPSKTPISTTAQNQGAATKPVTLPPIATDKPNYLSLDFQNSDADAIKKTLLAYAEKVTQTKASVPVAFILTDEKNNPIPFKDFAQAISLTIPQNIMTQLGPGFTLYLYNDTSHTRIGLAITEKNDIQLAAALLQEEPSFPQDIKPLFLASSYTLNNTPFNSSSYNGTSIRYNNIISPDNLSVDYTLYQNQLLIGTTELTLRSTIDLLNSQAGSTTDNTGSSQ